MQIRKATTTDTNAILTVNREAFHGDAVPNLVSDILADATAEPILSLIAAEKNRTAGHILFSKAYLPNSEVSISILAPLAVIPQFQRQGIGGELIKKGLELQTKAGVELVFVLGHPTYYPRSGFKPAFPLGFEASYPIPQKDADAWMVQALKPGIIGSVRGKVVCCKALDKPEHWRE